jgi:hypothetical protein
MDSRLKCVCSGLLESYGSKHSNIAPDARVVFLHRTVSDLFKKPNIWDKSTKHTHGTSFSPHLSLLWSCILQLKAYAKKAKDSLGSGFLALLDQLDATYQWRMSGLAEELSRKGYNFIIQGPKERQDWSKLPRKFRSPHFLDLESEPDSDDYFEGHSDEEFPTCSSVPQWVISGFQPQHMGERRTIGYKQPSTTSKNIPIGAGYCVSISEFRASPVSEGHLHNWAYGIEFLGVKTFKHVVPFYDLAKALSLQHYIAAKMRAD